MKTSSMGAAVVASVLWLAGCSAATTGPADTRPRPRPDALITDYAAATITAPPAHFGWDSTFYRKYVDASGIPVISSAKVPDEALLVARDIISHMLLKRPDVRAEMVRNGTRVGIMATTEFTTDIPEQRDWKKPAIADRRLTPGERARYNEPGGIGSMTDKEYWDRRARGMGGRYTTGAEENVLGYPGTRYFGEHILVHEFSHAIMPAVRAVDPPLYRELQAAYDSARARQLYLGERGSPHYAINTIAEYWAEGTQWWFWNNYPATFAAGGTDGGARTEVWSPEDLARYDPALYGILGRMYPDNRIPMDVYHGKRLRSERAASGRQDTVRVGAELLRRPDDARWSESAPATFVAEFETSRGRFAIEVQRSWAPFGADRFYNLVRHGYYDDARFHRVLPGYIVQWGIHAQPDVYRLWQNRFIPGDSLKQSNQRGTIGFAMTEPGKASTQVYINLADNSRNDPQQLAPFGRIIEGMEVVDSLYSGYGEQSGGGLRAGQQGAVAEGGNAYLDREWPRLDRIIRARIRPRS